MSWNKFKSLFVVTEGSEAPPAKDADAILKDLEKYELPAGEVGTLPASTPAAALSGTIDFQALYDEAGIPNTDEVEALERFLTGLDASLPQAARVAAAKAFLSAIGKSTNDVLGDAGRKIGVVRAVGEAKLADVERATTGHQSRINDLQRQIDEERVAIQNLQRELEEVRAQCATEEARLQGARVFFGYLGEQK